MVSSIIEVKKMKILNKKIRYLVIFICLLLLLYILFSIDIIRKLGGVATFSFILAYSLKPVHKKVMLLGINKKISAIFIISFFLVLFIFSFITIIPIIIRESKNLYPRLEYIDSFITNIYEKLKLSNNKTLMILEELIGEKVNRYIVDISSSTVERIIEIGENSLGYAVVPVLSYYFLIDEEIISEKLLMIFPVKSRRVVTNIAKDIDEILGRYIISQFILCFVIWIFTFVSLVIFKIEFPLLLSLINGLFNIIPYFGPLFGAVPIIIMALFQSTEKALWITLFLYIIQQIEGDVVSPKIIGYSTSMHPMIIILLILIGGKLGGLLGLIIAVPIGVIIKVIYEDIN